VNLASRLEEIAEKNQILVSEETKNKINKKFILRLITVDPKYKIKGFEYIKKYFEVLK